MPDTPDTVSGGNDTPWEITPADVENAKRLAEETAFLLLFIFLFGKIGRDGKPIPEDTIRKLIDKLVMVAGRRITAATTDYLEGRIPVVVWQNRMGNILRAGYTASSVINLGGLKNMTLSDWDYVGQWSERQVTYLNRFARQLIDPEYDITDVAMLRRSRSYATAIRSVGNNIILNGLQRFNYRPGNAYRLLLKMGKAAQRLDETLLELRHARLKALREPALYPVTAKERAAQDLAVRHLKRESRKARGLIRSANAQAQRIGGERYEVRRVLGVAEHCEGCIWWADEWMPPEVLPPLGTQECMSHCKCTIETRLVAATPAAQESSRLYIQPPVITVRV